MPLCDILESTKTKKVASAFGCNYIYACDSKIDHHDPDSIDYIWYKIFVVMLSIILSIDYSIYCTLTVKKCGLFESFIPIVVTIDNKKIVLYQ